MSPETRNHAIKRPPQMFHETLNFLLESPNILSRERGDVYCFEICENIIALKLKYVIFVLCMVFLLRSEISESD